jgi:oligopeptidase A
LQDTPFPLFDEVKVEHVVPGITQLLDELNAELDELEKKVQPTWNGLVEPLERLTDRLSLAWGTVSHLKVCSPDCRITSPPQMIPAC